jgi:hypothetical protein
MLESTRSSQVIMVKILYVHTACTEWDSLRAKGFAEVRRQLYWVRVEGARSGEDIPWKLTIL